MISLTLTAIEHRVCGCGQLYQTTSRNPSPCCTGCSLVGGPKATVHNLYKEPMDRESDVYVGRAGKGKDGYFGNPFKTTGGDHRSYAIARFEVWVEERGGRGGWDPEYRERVKWLHSRRLFCFCVGAGGTDDCHAKILAAKAAQWILEDLEGAQDG